MKTLGSVILDKLTSIENRMTKLEANVKALSQDNFLFEEYKEPELVSTPEPAKPRKKYKKGVKRNLISKLPPKAQALLLADNELAEGTINSYASILRAIVKEPCAFEVLIEERNKGTLAEKIAHCFKSHSRFYNPKFLANAITVGKRYGLVENVDGKYVLTDEFRQIKWS